MRISMLETGRKNAHPLGMWILAFTELFERFSYYTLSFLLVLFASDTVTNGGLGWTKEAALGIISIYTFGAFTLPILGGFLADRFIGPYHSSILGALLIILGHFAMLFAESEHLFIFYFALVCVALGTGFFKPCLPTLLGNLYAKEDRNRGAGFSYYYMGINIGAALAGVSGGLLLQYFGYRIALSSAGVGMVFGLFVFIYGRRYLELEVDVDSKEKRAKKETTLNSANQRKAMGYADKNIKQSRHLRLAGAVL